MTVKLTVDRGPLERLMGTSSTARILDHLYTFREFDYSVSEIAEACGLSRRTVQKALERLRRYGVVSLTRTVGRAKMFRVRGDTPIARGLRELISEIAAWDAELIAQEAEPITIPERRLEIAE